MHSGIPDSSKNCAVPRSAFRREMASASFIELQAEISDTENKIAAARRYLNNATNEYNTSREQFPSNIVADAFSFPTRATAVIAPENRTQMETAPAVRF